MKKYKRFLYVIVMVVVVSITVGYASFCSDMSISNIVADIRLTKDARVTAFAYSSATGSATTSYTNYNKKTLLTDITLPSSSSTITYKVTVTNFGNVDMGIYELTGLPSNLTYSVTDYTLQDKICDSSNNCTLGANKTFYVTIKYATNGYNSSSTSYSLKVGVDFRQFYTISYDNGITNNNYPSSIISGGNLNVTFGDSAPDAIMVYKDGILINSTSYTYDNGNFIFNNVSGNLSIRQSEKLTTMISGGSGSVVSDRSIDFSKVASSTNGQGLYVMSGTEEDEYPIYYYRGTVTNNNVLFANFCWKIVRTTETGGTKLLYNGVPASDGSCNNTDAESVLIGSGMFNEGQTYADVGYMYGDKYENLTRDIQTESIEVVDRDIGYSSNNTTYYANVTYSSSTGRYTLSNPVSYHWDSLSLEEQKKLIGYYRVAKGSGTSASIVDYIIGVYDDGGEHRYAISFDLTGGQMPDDVVIKLGKGVASNSDGTYTLSNITSVKKKDWINSYSQYVGYYLCPDLTSTTCDNKYISVSTDNLEIYYELEENTSFVYGNDVSYSNGTYTLVDTISAAAGWTNTYKIAAEKYHYTCFNKSGTCSTVYYLDELLAYGSSTINYLELSNGDTIEDAKNKMFSNKNDSIAKSIIDDWYESNLIEYTALLEDTPWCNDRSLMSGELKGKDSASSDQVFISMAFTVGGTQFSGLNPVLYTFEPTLSCLNTNDAFTVSKSNGNGALKYPIGMLTISELQLAGSILEDTGNIFNALINSVVFPSSSYLDNSLFWTMTPAGKGFMLGIYQTYQNTYMPTNEEMGIRPSISLKKDVLIVSGDGSVTTPYVVNDNYSTLSSVIRDDAKLDTNVNFGTATTSSTGKYIVSGTEDDENPIYYYRGRLTNNNLLFANFCWKIVRTTEDGGTKLIYNGTPTNGQCTGADPALSATSMFNSKWSTTDDVKYLYADGTSSTIKTAVDNWYAANLTAYTDMLEDTKWCSDYSVASTSGSNTYFGSHATVAVSPYKPKLTCDSTYQLSVSATETSKHLTYPVALLTADEATLAGTGLGAWSTSDYLSTGAHWWVLSPYGFESSSARGFYIHSSGRLYHSYIGGNFDVRPSIVLKKGTLLVGGDGSVELPYMVINK